MTTNTTFNKDAEERLNDPADQPNTRANACLETRKALLAATPERFAVGSRAVKLSEAARLMRSLNALPFQELSRRSGAAGITEQEALSGCDELSAALGGVLHAAQNVRLSSRNGVRVSLLGSAVQPTVPKSRPQNPPFPAPHSPSPATLILRG